MFKNSKIPIWLRLRPRKWLYKWHLTLTSTPKKIFKVTLDSDFDAKNLLRDFWLWPPIFDFQFDFRDFWLFWKKNEKVKMTFDFDAQIWFSIWLSWSLTPKKSHSRRTLISISINYTYFPKQTFIRRRLVLFYTMRLWAVDHVSVSLWVG